MLQDDVIGSLFPLGSTFFLFLEMLLYVPTV